MINLLPKAKINRDEFIARMSEKGIGTSVHFIPLHIQPYWKNKYNLQDTDFPNAAKYYASAVSLPLYTRMSDADQDYVITTINQIMS